MLKAPIIINNNNLDTYTTIVERKDSRVLTL